ncbi:MAG TPA: asparagine synthase (glutamine-hydrolyzing) [Thermoanaerobaculia bacterium]|nr:asparagine synthase (glutamine-hydrolyzing) [Thermoanaerobaculia bacterium]
MCGIAGILLLDHDARVAPDALAAMAAVQEHRGPDDQGLWIDAAGRVGLSHRRLSIVDLSPAGHQPMADAEGQVRVVFNGEIYNFPALRDWLEGKGYRFRSHCDTEVLLHLYRECGDAMVERLDGDFAFGLWDEPRQHLLLARDRMGVKPLYYVHLPGGFAFASELKALFRSGLLGPELDPESLYHYLTFLMVPPPRTLFRGADKLPAAGMLTLDLAGAAPRVQRHLYWEPLPGRVAVGPADLDDQLEELFRRSVAKRLMSDVPVGVLFSGGVDSTLNAAAFGEIVAPDRVRTYTVGMAGDGGYQDESDWARQQAAHLGTEHHEVHITEDDLLGVSLEMARHHDEPLSDPASVPLYFVARLARETGTIVLQAGEGADELFCGYDDYRRWIERHRRFWMPLSRLPRFAGRAGFEMLRHSRHPLRRKMADVLLRRSRGQELFLSSAVGFYENEKRGVLSPEFRRAHRALDSFDLVAPLHRRFEQACPEGSLLQRMIFIELQQRLPELLLMRIDKMTMATSVEARVPFLDRDLVDFALSVPDAYKLRDGILKEPLKRLASRSVARDRVYRPKRGFTAPIQQWFRTGLGREMRQILADDRHELGAFFDLAELERRLDGPLSTINQAFQLWIVFNFALWRRSMLP